jgi:hypothetical protein
MKTIHTYTYPFAGVTRLTIEGDSFVIVADEDDRPGVDGKVTVTSRGTDLLAFNHTYAHGAARTMATLITDSDKEYAS